MPSFLAGDPRWFVGLGYRVLRKVSDWQKRVRKGDPAILCWLCSSEQSQHIEFEEGLADEIRFNLATEPGDTELEVTCD